MRLQPVYVILSLVKSAGPDKIVSALLKHVDQNVADFLVQHFNKLYDEGIFPNQLLFPNTKRETLIYQTTIVV